MNNLTLTENSAQLCVIHSCLVQGEDVPSPPLGSMVGQCEWLLHTGAKVKRDSVGIYYLTGYAADSSDVEPYEDLVMCDINYLVTFFDRTKQVVIYSKGFCTKWYDALNSISNAKRGLGYIIFRNFLKGDGKVISQGIIGS